MNLHLNHRIEKMRFVGWANALTIHNFKFFLEKNRERDYSRIVRFSLIIRKICGKKETV